VLTSGNVGVVGSPATFANTNDGGGNVRGNTDMDVSILKIDLSVPSTANCLTFDFRFLSEEYPGYVATQFNDAFIAELDSSTWTTSGSTISAPNNFAFDSSNNVVSINSTGLGGMSAAGGAGTALFVPNPGVNCVPGAQPVNFKLALTPATASNPTGTPHTVTATLTDTANNPVGSAPIEFTVTGPNATTGTSTTNASGQATFT
jgi:Bacterial Ig-like domain (group 1)